MTDLAVVMLVTEGLALSAFVYYLDHKRRMYLLEKCVSNEEPPDARLERRLFIVRPISPAYGQSP